MATIIIVVEGGLIQDIRGIPSGVTVEVRDLDVAECGVDEDRVNETSDGSAVVTTYDG